MSSSGGAYWWMMIGGGGGGSVWLYDNADVGTDLRLIGEFPTPAGAKI
jgi:hypothetical protein